MELEPAVVERIEREKRSLRNQKNSTVLPPIVGILVLVGLNIWLIVSARTAVSRIDRMSVWLPLFFICVVPTFSYGLYSKRHLELPALSALFYAISGVLLIIIVIFARVSFSSEDLAFTFVLPAVLLLLYILCPPVLISLAIIGHAREQFASLLSNLMPDSISDTSLESFRNGLEGVGIALDITDPVLAELPIPSSSTLTALDKNARSVVLVSKSALDASLTDQEVEGLMAHELSHLVIGEVAKPPGFRDLGTFSPLYPVAIVQLAASCLLLSTDTHAMILLTILVILAGFLGVLLGGYLSGKFSLIEKHDDLLADSIAVKVNGDAQALKSAIVKLSEAGLLTKINLKLMPYIEPRLGRYMGYLSVGPFSEQDIAQRIENLEEIERGHWQEFEEVVRGRPIFTSSKWE